MTLLRTDIVDGILDPAQIRPTCHPVVDLDSGDLFAVNRQNDSVRGVDTMASAA